MSFVLGCLWLLAAFCFVRFLPCSLSYTVVFDGFCLASIVITSFLANQIT